MRKIIYIFFVILGLLNSSAVYGDPSPKEVGHPLDQVKTIHLDSELPNLGRSIGEFVVTDLLLASDVEGNVHALNRGTGELIWTLNGQKPLVQSSNAKESDPDTDITWIVEPYSEGSLFFFNKNFGLQRVSTSIKDLVSQSPFAINGDDKIYTGLRKTSLYKVNAKTGEVINSFGLGDDENKCMVNTEDSAPIVLLGKTTYELTIYSQSANSTLWNVTYTSWGPNNLDNDLVLQNEASIDGVYIAPFHDSSLLAIDSQTKVAKWISNLPTVAIDVFDVFQDLNTENFVLLPHPLHPHLNDKEMGEMSAAGNHDTFVGRTKSGSFFAMSELNYPSLVKSAPVAKFCLNERWRRAVNFADDDSFFSTISGVHKSFAGQNSLQLADNIIPSAVGDLRQMPDDKARSHEGQTKASERSWLSLPTADMLSIDPPQYHHYSLKRFIFRVFENTLTTILFFMFIVALSRLGVLPPITQMLSKLGFFKRTHHAVELVDQLMKSNDNLENSINLIKRERANLEESQADETDYDDNDDNYDNESNDKNEEDDEIQNKIDNIKENQKITKKVTILEPLDDQEGQQDSGTAPPTKKSRKRGSRGGKKNKKNKDPSATTLEPSSSSSPTDDVETIISTTSSANEINNTMKPKNNLVLSDVVLGYGSHGTVVYKGTFENRPVAIKRMLIDFYDVASQEVHLLQESDDHPNVIRYFCSQENDRFLYIALELCSATLEDVLDKPQQYVELCKKMDPVDVLYQITKGLHHLHSLKIVHRDIKPQNILVVPPKVLKSKSQTEDQKKQEQKVRMLISDFGLCKKLEADQSSFRATTAQAAGTSGWRAPELLVDGDSGADSTSVISQEITEPLVYDEISNRRLTRAIDIFSMGCVFYYVLTNGQHPFGDRYLREGNIVKGQYNLDTLEILPDQFESRDLISQMIDKNPSRRPDTVAILKHPFFWPVEKKLDFLLKVSDRFEIERRDPPSELLQKLEAIAPNVVGAKGWYSKFDQEFLDNLGKYRKYDTFKLMDLLRAIRNKYHHFNDLEPSLLRKMSPLPEGFYNYYTAKFPNLVMEIYYVVERELRHEDLFSNTFF